MRVWKEDEQQKAASEKAKIEAAHSAPIRHSKHSERKKDKKDKDKKKKGFKPY